MIAPAGGADAARSWLRGPADFARAYLDYRPAAFATALLAGFVLVAVAAGVLPLADPNAFGSSVLVAPGPAHLLGTDNFGRDLLSRTVGGTRTALLVALVSAGISVTIGVVLGSVAGLAGGWLDDALSRIFDIFLLIPAFFLLILVTALFGQSLWLVMVVIGLTTWPSSARIMRSQALTYRTRVFVEAARAAGAGPAYLLRRHVVPNGLAPVITNATILMGQAVLTEAGLSFLGLGDPNVISWGRMIYDGETYLATSSWMSLVPGLAMFVLVVCLNFAGDGIAFAFSPRGRGGRASGVARS